MSKTPNTGRAATIQDVARAAGVAKATASYALSGKGHLTPQTRELVLKAARELGFEPNLNAQRLSQGRSHDTIGVFAPHLDLGVSARKVQYIQRLLATEGFRSVVYTGGYRNEQSSAFDTEAATLLSDLRRQKPRALVCNVSGFGSAALNELERFAAEGGVVVTYDYPVDLACDQVIFDREDNTYQATRHLLEQGHRDLGLYMPGFPGAVDFQASHPRVLGFKRALHEFGIEPRTEWLIQGGEYEAGGAFLAQQFLALEERPTGFCIVNDDAAAAFIGEIGRAGVRVPEDLSIVSHDDLPLALYFPVPLTTVSHPVTGIAHAIHDLLFRRLHQTDVEPRIVTIRGALQVRGSVAPF